MNSQKIKAKVIDKIVNTPDVVTIYFTVGKKLLEYKSGQYITVYFEDTNIAQGKAYSLSSCPNDDVLSITVKKIGLFSGKIHSLKIGDTFLISNAYGFFNIGEDEKPIVALASGVGIAPIWGIIRDACTKDKKRSVTLLYSNKTEKDIVFKSEIKKLEQKNKNFSVHFFVTREKSSVACRRIDLSKDLTSEMLDSVFYICGSIDFSRSIWKQLHELGVCEDNISTETFFEAS